MVNAMFVPGFSFVMIAATIMSWMVGVDYTQATVLNFVVRANSTPKPLC